MGYRKHSSARKELRSASTKKHRAFKRACFFTSGTAMPTYRRTPVDASVRFDKETLDAIFFLDGLRQHGVPYQAALSRAAHKYDIDRKLLRSFVTLFKESNRAEHDPS